MGALQMELVTLRRSPQTLFIPEKKGRKKGRTRSASHQGAHVSGVGYKHEGKDEERR